MERDDVQGISVVVTNQLSMEIRLLHHVLAQILVLKTGCFDFITKRELMLMVVIIQWTVINMPGLMARQM